MFGDEVLHHGVIGGDHHRQALVVLVDVLAAGVLPQQSSGYERSALGRVRKPL
jgi:hypothetical protein